MGKRMHDTPPGDAAVAQVSPGARERPREDEEIDIETALLALSEDMSGPTVDVDLSALSPVERGAVLRCLRERLGLAPDLPSEKTE